MDILIIPGEILIINKVGEKLAKWEDDDKDFVVTKAANVILKRVQKNKCVTIVDNSCTGKTATLRHVILDMSKNGFIVIPLDDPCELKLYCTISTEMIFMVDNFCGNFSLNKIDLEKWKTFSSKCDDYLKENVKLVLSKTFLKHDSWTETRLGL